MTKGRITFFEFECYYEGLSVCMENDDDFSKILQNEWGIWAIIVVIGSINFVASFC